MPSTTRPSTPASTAFMAPRRVGTTWKTVSPASLSWVVKRLGSPAEVVTKRTPCVDHESSMTESSRTRFWAMFTPKAAGQVPHGADLADEGVQLARGRLDDPQPTRRRDRRGQLRAGDPAHRRLDDGDLDAEQPGDAVVERRRRAPHLRIVRASSWPRICRLDRRIRCQNRWVPRLGRWPAPVGGSSGGGSSTRPSTGPGTGPSRGARFTRARSGPSGSGRSARAACSASRWPPCSVSRRSTSGPGRSSPAG